MPHKVLDERDAGDAPMFAVPSAMQYQQKAIDDLEGVSRLITERVITVLAEESPEKKLEEDVVPVKVPSLVASIHSNTYQIEVITAFLRDVMQRIEL